MNSWTQRSVELVTDCPKEGCKNEVGSSPRVENTPDTNTRIAKARHKCAFCEMNAQLMHCPVCRETCSHQDLVENSLTQWRKGYKLPAIDENEVLLDERKGVPWLSHNNYFEQQALLQNRSRMG